MENLEVKRCNNRNLKAYWVGLMAEQRRQRVRELEERTTGITLNNREN